MIIFFIIILFSVISAEDNNDTKFIDALPETVKKVLLDKIARRILQEVPEVESGEAAMADGEIIDAKLEEQSEFVSKILREEIDSLKARRQNSDDKLEVPVNDSTSKKNISFKTSNETATKLQKKDLKKLNDSVKVIASNDSFEHIDLTLRATSKRAGDGDNDKVPEHKNKNDDVNEEKKATIEVNIDKNDTKVINIQQNVNESLLRESQNQRIKHEINKKQSETEESNMPLENSYQSKEATLETKDNSAILNKSNITSSLHGVTLNGPETSSISVTSKSDNYDKLIISGKEDLRSLSANKNQSIDSTDFATTETKSFTTKDVFADIKEKIVNLTKKPISDVIHEERKLEDEKDISKIVTDTIKKLEEKRNLSRAGIKTDSPFINNENNSSEYLENSPFAEKFTMKNMNKDNPTQIMMATAKPFELNTNKPDHEIVQGSFTTFSSLITTSTSYEVTTESDLKVTTNTEIFGKASKEKSGKTVLHTRSNQKNTEEVNNKNPKTVQDNKMQTKKPCNDTNTINNTKSDCGKLNLTKTETSTEAIGNVQRATSNQKNAEDFSNKTIKTVQGDEINLQTKKPFNNTNTLNDTKSYSGKSNVTTTEKNNEPIENNSDKSKAIVINDSLNSNNKQPSSAEHFGDLRIVKEPRAFDKDSNKIIETSSNDNAEQPHYYPVYNYESKDVHFNAYNRLGPNVDDDGNRDDSKSFLREKMQDYNKKHSSSAEHFGDLQVAKEYQVYEVDAKKPSFVQENNNAYLEQPQYFPVYNYEPQNAYYNAFNRLGPNADEKENGEDTIILESTTVVNGKRMLRKVKQNFIKEKTLKTKSLQKKLRVEPRYKKRNNTKMDEVHEQFVPESFEAANPFQVGRSRLKNRLEATRHILYRNKVFGYIPTNQERTNDFEEMLGTSKEDVLLLRTREDTKDNVRENKYDANRDYHSDDIINDDSSSFENLKESEENSMNKKYILVSRSAPSNINVTWHQSEKKATFNGITYDLGKFLPPESKDRGNVIANQDDTFDEAKKYKIDVNIKNEGLFNSTDQSEMINIIGQMVNSEKNKSVTKLRDGYEAVASRDIGDKDAETKTTFVNEVAAATPAFKIRSSLDIDIPTEEVNSVNQQADNKEITVDSKKILRQNEPQMINTIEKVLHLTPEIDMTTNLEEMIENKVPIMRSRDDDLELHLKILKDIVKMKNPALDKYDWLGTTVDIQSALTKLLDLINRKRFRLYIHPSDLQLLKYTEAIFKTGMKATLEREEETIKLGKEEYNKRGKQKKRIMPKSTKKISNPLKIINKMYKVRTSGSPEDRKIEKKAPVNLEKFLLSMQDGLYDLHNVIKQISMVTKYNNQRWYKNIKELYLVKAGKKEYLDILLHLFSTRLFELIEESSKNGVEEDYKAYIKKNRAEVDRTEVEVMFIVRILKAIKNLRY